MQTWQYVVLGLGFVAWVFIGVATIGTTVWIAVLLRKLVAAIIKVNDSAPDLANSITGLSEVAEALKVGNKATEGHIKLGQQMMLEYKKLGYIIQRFERMVIQPQMAAENAKHGFQMQTDADADKEAAIQELMAGGYTREEAESLTQNQVGGI